MFDKAEERLRGILEKKRGHKKDVGKDIKDIFLSSDKRDGGVMWE